VPIVIRRSIVWVPVLVGAALLQGKGNCQAQSPLQVQDHIKVERVVVSLRVIDRFANPIPDLVAADFRLRVDGHEAAIESVEWIAEGSSPELQPVMRVRNARSPQASAASGPRDPGTSTSPRLIVMLFQWEIAGQKDIGFVRMMRQAERFAESARPGDRIAVFGFGSSLRLLQDFTTDRAAITGAIERIRGLRQKPGSSSEAALNLSDPIGRCGQVDSIERGLICIGRSLQSFPGPKTLLFFGWTVKSHLSRWHANYPAIIEAVGKAQTTVDVLDVSDGYHSLAKELRIVAEETGGIYQATHLFPDLARLRVQHSLEGRYELVFKSPSTDRGWHRLDIQLNDRAGTLLFQRWYQD
jgi:VWFA-related protein